MAIKKSRSSNKSKGVCKLTIDQDMNIYVIDEMKQALTKEMDDYESFELDLSEVDEFDSAGVQLLIAFQNTLLEQKKSLSISAMGDSVLNLLNSYCITERFANGGVQ